MSNVITNPAGAFGYSDLQTELWSSQAPFKASADITAKAVVAFDTTGTVAAAPTNGVAGLCVGVAVQAISSGVTGNVVVIGIAEDVPCDGAVAAGDTLKRSTTNAGKVSATATPGVGEKIGIAINASSSNTVDMWVCK